MSSTVLLCEDNSWKKRRRRECSMVSERACCSRSGATLLSTVRGARTCRRAPSFLALLVAVSAALPLAMGSLGDMAARQWPTLLPEEHWSSPADSLPATASAAWQQLRRYNTVPAEIVRGRRTQSAQSLAPIGDEPEATHDFTFEGETVLDAMEELVVTKASVYGEFLQSQMMDIVDVVKSTVIAVCSCDPESPECDEATFARVSAVLMQDIETFGNARIGLGLDVYVMVPKGGASACADNLAIAGYGKDEPPFDVVPPPLFRALMQFQMRGNVKTFDILIDTWRVQLDLPTCETLLIAKPLGYPVMAEDDYDPNKVCGDFSSGAAADVLNTGAKTEWHSPSKLCKFAITPCMCAALPACGWYTDEAGGMRCVDTPRSSVSCSHCPLQADCPLNPAQICAQSFLPCPCVQSPAGCYWSEKDFRCKLKDDPPKVDQVTSCISCVLQWRCDPPKKTKKPFFPSDGRTMPSGEDDHINITFDRLVKFRMVGQFNPTLVPAAVQFICRLPPPSMPAVHTLGLDRLYWQDRVARNCSLPDVPCNGGFQNESEGDILTINVTGSYNEEPTDCDLLINPDAIVAYEDNLPFEGVLMGEYSFGMSDTAGPRIMDISPRNGIRGLDLTTAIEFSFNEEVRAGPNPYGVLLSLGAGPGADPPNNTNNTTPIVIRADMIVATIELTRFEENKAWLDLSGLEPSTLYTVGLSASATMDPNKNVFNGYREGEYLFKTRAPVFTASTTTTEAPDEDEQLRQMLYYIGGAVAGVWFLGLTLGYMALQPCRHRKKMLEVIKMEAQTRTPESIAGKEWNGSWFHSHLKSEVEGTMGTGPKLLGDSGIPAVRTPKGVQVMTPMSAATPAQRWRLEEMSAPASPLGGSQTPLGKSMLSKSLGSQTSATQPQPAGDGQAPMAWTPGGMQVVKVSNSWSPATGPKAWEIAIEREQLKQGLRSPLRAAASAARTDGGFHMRGPRAPVATGGPGVPALPAPSLPQSPSHPKSPTHPNAMPKGNPQPSDTKQREPSPVARPE
eukprot:TRINITY_DN90389_c0_g1_i1.p1 TRINITY_DN90389_c0_g1~~TRINITY_DN90389_c0_g1_i1.p1  ORF type:complete len:1018 (+),score=196.83 TRINITY_DN90389_c0_g1_i1:306-3359(+)